MRTKLELRVNGKAGNRRRVSARGCPAFEAPRSWKLFSPWKGSCCHASPLVCEVNQTVGVVERSKRIDFSKAPHVSTVVLQFVGDLSLNLLVLEIVLTVEWLMLRRRWPR